MYSFSAFDLKWFHFKIFSSFYIFVYLGLFGYCSFYYYYFPEVTEQENGFYALQ